MTTDTHPRYGRTGCTCDMYDSGGGESGPRLSIDRDILCPFHGRKADPAYWAECDMDMSPEYYLWSAHEEAQAQEHLRTVTPGSCPCPICEPHNFGS